MGVLKNLTDEYFEKTLRAEDGKYLDVFGYRVKVPAQYDKTSYLKMIGGILQSSPVCFADKEDSLTTWADDIHINCGESEIILNVDTFETFSEKSMCKTDIDEEKYELFLDFLKLIMKDIDVYKKPTAVVVLFDNVTHLIDICQSDGLEKYNYRKYLKKLLDSFFDEFGKKANLVKHYIQFDSTEVIIDITNEAGRLKIKTILYLKDMIKWWDDKIEEIEKMGARKYFNIK